MKLSDFLKKTHPEATTTDHQPVEKFRFDCPTMSGMSLVLLARKEPPYEDASNAESESAWKEIAYRDEATVDDIIALSDPFWHEARRRFLSGERSESNT
jgi:hypothetical protein